jgi:hypothetical protein
VDEDLDMKEAAGPRITGPRGSRKCRACSSPVPGGTRQCPGCGAAIPRVDPRDYVLVGGALFLICVGVYFFSSLWLRGMEPILRDPPAFEEQTREARERLREHMAERAKAEDATFMEELGNEMLQSESLPDPDLALQGAVEQVHLYQKIAFCGALVGFGVLVFGVLKLLSR